MVNGQIQSAFDFLGYLVSKVLTNFIIAVIIILIGFIIARIVEKILHKVLQEIELDAILKKAANIRISIAEVISRFVKYFIYFITIIMALNQIGLTTTLLNMISAAILIVIIISIFLGIKDFVPNLIAGFFIHQKRYFKEGDVIKVNDVKGKIIHINLVETTIETKSGDTIYIPNSRLTKTGVVKIKSKK